ncbi:MAG: 3-phosphoshikimate 1-carboxyvinyltransferase, partial [Okeania sp. SIO2D1]|nr:3-phosphoshikimate 1-carboxyvinyltransferase [Okeania sp. SIO2D1]
MTAAVVTTKITNSQETLIIQRPQSGLCLKGNISIPGDKSISHRSLMLGAIAQGKTTIKGLLLGEDPRSTAKCFSLLGADISQLNTDLVEVE